MTAFGLLVAFELFIALVWMGCARYQKKYDRAKELSFQRWYSALRCDSYRKFFPGMAPLEFVCSDCSAFYNGAGIGLEPGYNCECCSNTGRFPMPFTEVWGL